MKLSVINPPTIEQENTQLVVPVTIENYVRRQIEWSTETFGPGDRSKGVSDHIRKELEEIEENPLDTEEWIDVLILGFDGAWRCLAHLHGYQNDIIGHIVAQMLEAKFYKNEAREWPDWRTQPTDQAIEHVRTEAEIVQKQKPRGTIDPIERLRASLNSALIALQDDSYKIYDRSIDAAAIRDIQDALTLLDHMENDMRLVADAFKHMHVSGAKD